MPSFWFRSAPLPSLRTYTIVSIVAFGLAVLVTRHQIDKNPDLVADQADNTSKEKPEETRDTDNESNAGVLKWVWPSDAQSVDRRPFARVKQSVTDHFFQAIISLGYCVLLWLGKAAERVVLGELRVGEQQV